MTISGDDEVHDVFHLKAKLPHASKIINVVFICEDYLAEQKYNQVVFATELIFLQ